LLQFEADKLTFCFFKKQVLKSYLALQCLLFVAATLGGQCEFICEQHFFRQRTVTSFYANRFKFLNSIRFSFHGCLCFICYSFSFAACTLHGVWRQWGRTLLTSAAARYRHQFQQTKFCRAFSFYLVLLFLYRALVPGGRFSNSPPNAKPYRCASPY
jgi:hypothetical protein